MKKLFLVFLCFALIFCMSACAHTNPSDTDSVNNNDPITSQETGSPALRKEYEIIISNLINAYPWDDDDLTIVSQNPELSYMYRQNAELREIGFALLDLDKNGREELIISDPSKPFVYDLYTISDGKAVHLFSGGEKYSFYLYENGYIENQWSDSAASSGHDFYRLTDGTLDLLERITLDAKHALNTGIIKEISQANEDNCFFVSSTDKFEDYKSVSFAEAMERIDTHQNANKQIPIEFTLLSEYDQ